MVHDDLLGGEVRDEPHRYFHALRAEDPVHWNARHKGWVLTRYDDVLAAFRDPRLSSARLGPDLPPAVARNLRHWMVFLDPPEHTRLRRLVGTALSPRAVEEYRARVETAVDELLAPLEGPTEWVTAVAEPLPEIVIADVLGVPRDDRAKFLTWSSEISRVVFGAVYRSDRYEQAARSMDEFDRYFRDLIVGGGTGMVAAIARVLEGDEQLTTEEVIATCTLLLFAGHETTTNLLSAGLLTLLRFPDQLEALRADPALAGAAVDELLRLEGPTGMMVRRAREDVTIRGKTIRAGDRVFLGVAAANHDPDRFGEPDRLDITRPDNGHLGFGFGIHHCLGAPLARLEAQATFTALLERFSKIRVLEEPAWSSSLLGRRLRHLVVELHRGGKRSLLPGVGESRGTA